MRSSRYHVLKPSLWPLPFFHGACLQVRSTGPSRGMLSIVDSELGLASRCLHGMLNGNTGIMKSMMAELTDETNMARGFSLVPLTWAVGGTLGFDILLARFRSAADTRISLGHSLAVSYRGHKIVGQMCSRILSGANTRTSCPVSPPPHTPSSRSLLLPFS